MPSPDSYFDRIDQLRVGRARELSNIKTKFAGAASLDELSSKAVVVLCYAHWEGFYNDCIEAYVDFLTDQGLVVSESYWTMLVGLICDDLKSLADRNNSLDAQIDFSRKLSAKMREGFTTFYRRIVKARSNLDFDRLVQNYQILNFDISLFQRRRLRISKELVAWRHQVAHGDSPDLSRMDISDHVGLTNGLLLSLADQFQEAMVVRL